MSELGSFVSPEPLDPTPTPAVAQPPLPPVPTDAVPEDVSNAGWEMEKIIVGQDWAAAQAAVDDVKRPEELDTMFTVDSNAPSWWENTMSVVQSAGIVSGTIEAGVEGLRNMVDDTPDDTYNLESHIKSPEIAPLWKEIVDNYETDLASQEAYKNILLSPNAAVTMMHLEQAGRQREYYRILQQAGWSSWAAGLLGTIGLDIMATKGVLTFAATANIAKLGTLGRLSRVAETQANARLLGAARLAQFGAAEGLIESTIQKANDPYMTGFDVALALGLGTGIGGALGAGFPKALAGINNREALEAALAQQEDYLKSVRTVSAQSGGAQAVPREELEKLAELVPTKGGGETLLASKISKIAPIFSKIRAPSILARDTWARGFKEFNKTGLKGEYHFGNVIQRILKTSVMTADELGGKTARTKTVREALQEVETQVTATQFRVERSYLSAVRDAFDVGTMRARAGINQINEVPGASQLITKRALNGAPTLFEVQSKADDLAQARPEGVTEAVLDGYRQEWKAQGMSDLQADRLVKAVEEIELTDSAFYNSNKDRLVKAGLLEESELIDGYRPQNWNRDELANNEVAAKSMLLRVFSDEAPPEDWINNNLGARLLNDEPLPEGHADLGKPAIDLDAGERWEDFAAANPMKALELANEWYDTVRAAQVHHAEVFAIAMEQTEKLKTKDLGEGFIARLEKNIASSKSAVEFHKGRLDAAYKEPGTPWNMKKIDEVNIALGRAEKRLADLEETMVNTRRSAENIADDFTEQTSRAVRELQERIKKNGTLAQKRALKKIQKQTRTGAARVIKRAASSTVTERVDEAYKLLTSGQSAYGWIPDSLRLESKHFKHRGINLKHHRRDPKTARFLNKDSASAKRGYGNSALRELNAVELLGPLVRHQAGDDIEQMYKNFREFALSEFTEDLKKQPNNRAIGKRKRDAEKFIDSLLDMVTRKDLMRHDIGVAQTIATVQAGVSASALGFVLASQLADLGILAFAGGALGTGFRSLFKRNSKLFNEMAEAGDDLVSMALRGTSVHNQQALMARIDADNLITDIPGGRMRTIARTVQNVAQVEGWANFMHVWNRWVRQSFGADFAKQITRDMDNYENLSDAMKGFYAKHGISESDAKVIRELMAKSHKTYDNGKMLIPDQEGWLKLDRGSEMLDKYMRAVKGAGDEALLDPSMGDRPFLSSNPFGRLVLQFSSFSYTAGERFFAPLWQAGRLNPADTRVWAATMLSMLMVTVADGWRHHARGKGEEWRNSWDTEQGTFDNLKRGYMRSNFIFGMTGIGLDVGAGVAASSANNTWNAITDTDFNIINPEYARLNYGQRWTGLLGPAAGMAGTIERTVTDLSDGNMDKVANTAAARAPIANSLILWSMAEAIKSITGD
jgi:hypothetical protein